MLDYKCAGKFDLYIFIVGIVRIIHINILIISP